MHLKLNPDPFRGTPDAIAASGNYQPVSFWQETIAVNPLPELQGDIHCDVAVVGGGFSGLSVA